MKILCVFGKHNYGNPARGLSYEFANFLPALHCLGHETLHFESWDKGAHPNFAHLNRAFLESVESAQPDIIFCVLMHYELWLETLQEVRKRCNTLIIHWGTDDSWKYEQFARWVAPAFDIYATTSSEALVKSRKDGLGNFVLTQWGANSANLAKPLPAAQCQYQVSFIGSAYGNRRRWVSSLRGRGIDVACFGYGWENGPVKSEDISEIIRNSIISLNFGDSGLHLQGFGVQRSRQIKARVFEVPGAGGFLLTEDAPYLKDFYIPGKEVVVFNTVDDLCEKLGFFLTHPEQRDAIAKAGYERTLKEHTYEHRFRSLFDSAIQSCVDTGRPTPPKSCKFDDQWFAELKGRHEMGSFLRLLKCGLIKVFSIVWGRERGTRAARRLIYELSWRLSPGRTYTSAGIPGRMFYQES